VASSATETQAIHKEIAKMKHSIITLILFTIVMAGSASAIKWSNFGFNGLNVNAVGTGLPGGSWHLNNTLASAINPYNQAIVDDLDGNGDYEILMTRSNSLSVYSRTGTLLANSLVSNLNGHQPSLSYYSSACGGLMLDIVVVENDGNANAYLDVYCYNGTALYNHGEHIQVTSYDFYGHTDSKGFARCSTDSWYDCRYVYSLGSGYNVLGCDLFHNASLSTCSAIYSPGGSNFGTAAISPFPPVGNTQYDGNYHSNAIANVPAQVFIDDTGDAIGLSADLTNAREITLWARSGASMYVAIPQTQEIWVYDTAYGAKTLKFKISWDAAPFGVNVPKVSNAVVNENNELCAAFKDTLGADIDYEVTCKDALGTITKAFTWQTTGYASAGYLRLTATDVNGDGIMDFMFDGMVMDGAFGNVFYSLAYSDGWMQPVDLLGRGVTDIIASDSTGNVRIYLANTTNPLSCSDTDNATYPTINYDVQGTASFYAGTYTDYCVDDMHLNEYDCLSGTSLDLIYNHACANGCAAGACLTCAENWSCSPYSQCSSGSQSRSCYDLNGCGTTYFRPALSQACSMTTGNASIILIPTTLVDINNPTSLTSGAWLPELFVSIAIFFSYWIAPATMLLLAAVVAMMMFAIVAKLRG